MYHKIYAYWDSYEKKISVSVYQEIYFQNVPLFSQIIDLNPELVFVPGPKIMDANKCWPEKQKKRLWQTSLKANKKKTEKNTEKENKDWKKER